MINFSHTYLDGIALPLGMKGWDGRSGTLPSALPKLLTNVTIIRQVSRKAETSWPIVVREIPVERRLGRLCYGAGL
jgi:hypothetical protein